MLKPTSFGPAQVRSDRPLSPRTTEALDSLAIKRHVPPSTLIAVAGLKNHTASARTSLQRGGPQKGWDELETRAQQDGRARRIAARLRVSMMRPSRLI